MWLLSNWGSWATCPSLWRGQEIFYLKMEKWAIIVDMLSIVEMQVQCIHIEELNKPHLWVAMGTAQLAHWGRDKTAAIFQTTFSNAFFLNENVCIPLKISLKFVPEVRINSFPALVQIMAWRRPGDKPLSEPMRVNLMTHICVTRPQWVEGVKVNYLGYFSI